ncbi:glucosaminidase domain-containing protein [Alteromonas facilis]|uniref:glucosaminidase domain-containing protein n=1 Tax=Alteromonas facilis TaxID=2048004 RepID=UPI000C28EE48|nr:glucosaminidase domain-containing protein [Alteromonas facilis]
MNIKQIVWWLLVTLFVGFSFLYPVLYGPKPLVPEPPVTAREAEPEMPDFASIGQVKDKKSAFFDYLLPEVERQNDYIMGLRLKIKAIAEAYEQSGVLSAADTSRLHWLVKEYKVDSTLPIKEQLSALLRRVDIIPADLVLVQAANESAWGTSRFATQGYNFFGLWCFRVNCGFVPKQRTDGAVHEVAKFKNLAHATYTYMRNLNRHQAYKSLREIRYRLRVNQRPITGTALSEGLMQYSERGEAYIDELQHMIRINREFIST